jgi:hypothetical protein
VNKYPVAVLEGPALWAQYLCCRHNICMFQTLLPLAHHGARYDRCDRMRRAGKKLSTVLRAGIDNELSNQRK